MKHRPLTIDHGLLTKAKKILVHGPWSMVHGRCSKGFSLIEAIISIVLLSASFLGLVHVMSSTTTHNIDIDISTTSVMLAREVMDQTKAKSFSNVSSVSSTSFGGDFANYTYAISVGYVNSGDLNTTVAGPTSYKRITVTVTANGWTGNIALYDLRTDV